MKVTNSYIILFFTGVSFLNFSICVASSEKEKLSTSVLEKTKKSIVTIHGQASLIAYDPGSTAWTGTGFIINKKKGYILTNAHVAGGALIGRYEVVFYDGSQVNAKLLYDDPWIDYAFLQVDPQSIPQEATEIQWSRQDPYIGQLAFMVGNNEGKSLSIHTGTITGLDEIEEAMPQQAIRLSLNTAGGSSGSPIMNQQGEAIALNYSGGDTYALGLHPAYIRYALHCIEQGIIPVRKHIGVIATSYSLYEAIKYRKFPLKIVTSYANQFPLAMGKAIQVNRVLVGSPADGKIFPGDIIWAINQKEIGPNLVELDLALNQAEHSVCLTIYRQGQKQEVVIPIYNLEAHKIKKMVRWGEVVFFESDDFFSDKLGIPAKTLSFAITQGGTTFKQVKPYMTINQGRLFALRVLSIDQKPVLDLAELIQHIPSYIQQKYFTINYMNYLPENIYDYWYVFGPRCYTADVCYDEYAAEPKVFTFNQQKMEWESRPVGLTS